METATTITGRQYYPQFKPFLPSYRFDVKEIIETSVTVSPYKKEIIETSVTVSPYKYIEELELIEELESIYIFLNPNEIKSFLLLNKDLMPILFEAPNYIYERFGKGKVHIYLELYHDPEEEWDELFIVIKSSYSPEEAIKLENKLFEEWFVKIMDKVRARLNITEEPL